MACTAFRSIVLAAAAVSMTLSTTSALSIYLSKIPNGNSFTQGLGHPDNDSSQYTDFATAFAAEGHEWTSTLCQATFPGSTMTNGQAFGDPCCTWTVGGTPDFTVTAFTTSPAEATTCASSTSTASSAATETTEAPAATTATEAPAATPATPVATTAAPVATIAAPASTTATPTATKAAPATVTSAPTASAAATATKTSSSATTSPTTQAPSTSTKAPSSQGCSVKGSGEQKGNHTYNFRH